MALEEWRLHYCGDARVQPLATFSQTIQLAGAVWEDRYAEHLLLTLFWRAVRPPPGDFTVFVHVVDAPTGMMVGQRDQMPAAGQRPTGGWTPGVLVMDDYRIPLDTKGTAGPYRVYVGLYEPATGARLPVEAAALPVSEDRLQIHAFER
jgi:hypothetical protein